MKTAFFQGYADRPNWVTYQYHGITMHCRKAPWMTPYILIPTTPPGPLIATWELIYTVYLTGWPDWIVYYDVNDFLPSTGIDGCDVTFPDGKTRVYAYHAHLVASSYYLLWNDSDGYYCGSGGGYSEDPIVDVRVINKIYAGQDYLFACDETQAPTVVRVWRSSNGELPEGNPPWN